MARAIIYMHETSGACAGMCACDRMHKMEKTGKDAMNTERGQIKGDLFNFFVVKKSSLFGIFQMLPSFSKKIHVQNKVFLISGFLVKSLVNKNYHNPRISNTIDINLGPVTKLDKKNTTTSKKLMLMSCQQIMTFLSFFWLMVWFGAIQNLDFEPMVYNFYIFINRNLLPWKKKENRKSLTNEI